MSFIFVFKVLLTVDSTSVTFNVTSHDVGQVTSFLLGNGTDLDRYVADATRTSARPVFHLVSSPSNILIFCYHFSMKFGPINPQLPVN